MTIVCVDDHPIMLKGLSKNVRQLLPDAIIGSFGNAEEAMAFAKKALCCRNVWLPFNGDRISRDLQYTHSVRV